MAPKTKQVNAPATKAATAAQVDTLAQVPTTNAQLASASMPAWLAAKMKDQPARGLEEVEKDDIIFPRLVLCQGQTPFVQDGSRRIGDICDNLSGQLFAGPDESLEIIPVVFNKSRMFLVPMEEGGGIKCRSDDSKTARPNGCGTDFGGKPTDQCKSCIHKEWKDGKAKGDDASDDDDNSPDCTVFYNLVCLLPQFGMRVAVLSLKSTGVKIAKKLLSTAVATKADLFALKFRIWSVPAQSGTFQYRAWQFEPAGWATEEEYKEAEAFHNNIAGKKFEISADDLEKKADTSFDTDGMVDSDEGRYEGNLDEAATPPVAPAVGTKATSSSSAKVVDAKPTPAKADDGF